MGGCDWRMVDLEGCDWIDWGGGGVGLSWVGLGWFRLGLD